MCTHLNTIKSIYWTGPCPSCKVAMLEAIQPRLRQTEVRWTNMWRRGRKGRKMEWFKCCGERQNWRNDGDKWREGWGWQSIRLLPRKVSRVACSSLELMQTEIQPPTQHQDAGSTWLWAMTKVWYEEWFTFWFGSCWRTTMIHDVTRDQVHVWGPCCWPKLWWSLRSICMCALTKALVMSSCLRVGSTLMWVACVVTWGQAYNLCLCFVLNPGWCLWAGMLARARLV